jgi:hypothetical protein
MKFTMNFDTRTILDIISLNGELKESLFEIVLTEQESLDDKDEFNEDVLLNSAIPVIKNRLKDFLFRKELTNMELGILKGIININNIDYKFLIREVTS